MEYSTDLVNQARLGDAHAFARLYEMIYQDLYRFALYTLKNTPDAEDAVGDTVTDAFRQIRSLKKPEAFKSWMFKILTNKCKQRLKSYLDKTAELPEDLEAVSPDLNRKLDVQEAFWALDDEARMILSLNLFAGYTSSEVGQLLNLNENTVRSKQSRALKKMQEKLSD